MYPGKDEGGRFFHLAGIAVQQEHGATDVAAALLEETGRFIRERKVARLKFGTSPLLTTDAELYITRFGTRYRWRGGIRTPGGRPWPHVACECDFDDPLARSLDMRDDEVIAKSVVAWEGRQPLPRPRVVYSGPLAVLLPQLDSETLAQAGERDTRFLPALSSLFHGLFIHGYDFAWFDRLPAAVAPPGGPWFYYIMKPIVAL